MQDRRAWIPTADSKRDFRNGSGFFSGLERGCGKVWGSFEKCGFEKCGKLTSGPEGRGDSIALAPGLKSRPTERTTVPARLCGKEAFVAEDAVEGGAADAQLAGGAEFIATIEFEDELDVAMDDGVQGHVLGQGQGFSLEWSGGTFRGLDDGDLEMKVGGADDAGGGVKDG